MQQQWQRQISGDKGHARSREQSVCVCVQPAAATCIHIRSTAPHRFSASPDLTHKLTSISKFSAVSSASLAANSNSASLNASSWRRRRLLSAAASTRDCRSLAAGVGSCRPAVWSQSCRLAEVAWAGLLCPAATPWRESAVQVWCGGWLLSGWFVAVV